MTYSVYQHWDPLKVCIVGRSHPPEYYSWIQVPHVRNLFEKIAIETEEDYQNIIKKLEEFGVTVLRPDPPPLKLVDGKCIPPPMTPRDYMSMIGDVFYRGYSVGDSTMKTMYAGVKDPSWPECNSLAEFDSLPEWIRRECLIDMHFQDYIDAFSVYDNIFKHIELQGNEIREPLGALSSGAFVSRVGKDLYFGTPDKQPLARTTVEKIIARNFPNTRNHIVETNGHSDGVFCPVCPGLIISLYDVPTYQNTFPGWEVVYLPNQSWKAVEPFLDLKVKNGGKWWIPGFEKDQAVIDIVETWLDKWVGYVEETVFDVNMLIIDPKNVIVFNYNETVFNALARYGITPHIVPFRHRYFWDGGIHCVTSDLHREGTMQDYFPNRSL
jgi:N-dimethylarginine dimethylaminohydrolase